MGNLIKYEWRKQRLTRILILACLLAFIVLFLIGGLIKNETIVAVSILIITFAGMFGIFYVGIENLVILNRDLKTKAELYALDGTAFHIRDSWSKTDCRNSSDGICLSCIFCCRSGNRYCDSGK